MCVYEIYMYKSKPNKWICKFSLLEKDINVKIEVINKDSTNHKARNKNIININLTCLLNSLTHISMTCFIVGGLQLFCDLRNHGFPHCEHCYTSPCTFDKHAKTCINLLLITF